MTKKPRVSLQDSSSEIDELLKEEDVLETRHAFLATELAQVRRKISGIRSKRNGIQNRNNPLLNLPNEVTCIIFDYALAVSASWHESTRLPLFEVVASHVCRHWRSAALNYPRLWAHFRPGSKSSSLSSERFDAYLERSASSGLELWFKFSNGDNLEDFTVLLQKAMSHMQRWRRFSLFADHRFPALDVFAAMETVSVPMLEHFAFCAPSKNMSIDFRNGPPSLKPTVFKSGAPNLISAALNLTGYFPCMPPLKNITTLHLRGRSYVRGRESTSHIHRDILSLPFLVNLSIIGVIYEYNEPESGEKPITVPYLKHLCLTRAMEFLFLLPFMRAPSLETLIVRGVLPATFAAQALESNTLMSDLYIFPVLHSVCCIDVFAHSTASTWQFAKMTANASEITFCNTNARRCPYSESFFAFLADCSVLKEKEMLWKKVKVLTFDIDTSDLDGLLRFFKKRPKRSVILRLSDTANSRLKASSESKYAELAESYKLETLESMRNQLGETKLPPSTRDHNIGLFTEEFDPFGGDDSLTNWTDSDAGSHSDFDDDYY
ncbi:hypothetical protein CVT26_007968 [Gymnopilus dilepis]|uniref:Uncharacterized protein n=1 Tax=Gymnopilus dilepis TaxID=231916 RepID=A0A409W0I7_9AGAR|nr:hypothetical protein CVT26_007968 [Gymnopilus dilepis]